jgi:hypothetical protein
MLRITMINHPTLSPKKAGATGANAVMGRVKSSSPRVRRILVPLDFSGESRQALRYATPLAEKFSSRIILLHVIQPVYDAWRRPAGRQPAPSGSRKRRGTEAPNQTARTERLRSPPCFRSSVLPR